MSMSSPTSRFRPVAYAVAASLIFAGGVVLNAQNVRRVVRSAINSAQQQAGGGQRQGQQGQGQGQGQQGQGRGGGQAGQGGQARDNSAQQQQAAAVGTATISGSVVAEGAGTPVRKARVTLTAPELRGRNRVI